MSSKLKFYINSKGKKVYTLEDKIKQKQTLSAHYKFLKIKDVLEKDFKTKSSD